MTLTEADKAASIGAKLRDSPAFVAALGSTGGMPMAPDATPEAGSEADPEPSLLIPGVGNYVAPHPRGGQTNTEHLRDLLSPHSAAHNPNN